MKDELIREYFLRGHRYSIILKYLEERHNITISIATLKRRIRDLGLRRNNLPAAITPAQLIVQVGAIQHRTRNRAGYRRTWHILNYQHRIRVTQARVAECLRNLNPQAVIDRVRRQLIRRSYISPGPNYLWHIDGYDKLKPFGFAIHGCVDGYSRKIIWLKCGTTNSDPKVVLHHFLCAANTMSGCPKIVRSDCGTETGLAAAAQCSLTQNPRGHIFGPSCRNQRIESWWSKLRYCWSQSWIETFDDLRSFGSYDPNNPSHRSTAEFCFMGLLQRELDDFKEWWNGHHIRNCRTSGCPGGIPNELYDLPTIHGRHDYLQHINVSDVRMLFQFATPPEFMKHKEAGRILEQICNYFGWSSFPTSWCEASSLYLNLCNVLQI